MASVDAVHSNSIDGSATLYWWRPATFATILSHYKNSDVPFGEDDPTLNLLKNFLTFHIAWRFFGGESEVLWVDIDWMQSGVQGGTEIPTWRIGSKRVHHDGFRFIPKVLFGVMV